VTGRLLRQIDRLSALAMGAAVVLGAALIAVMLLEVVMRYGLGRPLIWSQEVTGILNACMFLSAAAPALRAGQHVTVGILADRLAPRLRHAILAVALGLMFLSGEVDEVSPWRHVLWPFYAAIALALLPFVLQVAAEALRHAGAARRRTS
jgi:TRAP-type mannitol/chloroaromatic compound transport system permease small subunit